MKKMLIMPILLLAFDAPAGLVQRIVHPIMSRAMHLQQVQRMAPFRSISPIKHFATINKVINPVILKSNKFKILQLNSNKSEKPQFIQNGIDIGVAIVVAATCLFWREVGSYLWNSKSESLDGGMHKACYYGDIKKVHALLHAAKTEDEKQKLLEIQNKYYKKGTPLITAASQGKTDMVKYLLSQGAQIDTQNELGDTALIAATKDNHFNIVIELLYANADVLIVNKENQNAYNIAAQNNNFKIADWIYQYEKKQRKAMQDLYEKVVQEKQEPLNPMHIGQWLMKYGAKTNVDHELLVASACGNIQKIKFQLDLGANINVQNMDGNTPLLLALMTYRDLVIDEVLKYNPDVFIKNKNGQTAYDIAKEFKPSYADVIYKLGALQKKEVQERHAKIK
jgi:hypothetical protein